MVYNHTGTTGFARFSTYEPGSFLFFSNLSQAVFCKVGVSMFFIISGALMLGKKQEGFRDLFQKRILKYLFILISISIVYGLSNHILKGTHYTAETFFKSLYSSNIKYHLWYIYAYIAFLILVPLLQSFCNGMQNRHFIYLILMHLSFRMISVIDYLFWKDALSLESHLIATLPINIVLLPMIGYYIENRVDITNVGKKLLILWTTNIVLIALSCYMTYIRGIDRGIFSEADSQRYFSYFTFMNCITVFLTIKYIFNRVQLKENLRRTIVLISGCCFGIYLIHIMFQDLPIRMRIMKTIQEQAINPVISAWVYVIYLFVPSLILSFFARWMKE